MESIVAWFMVFKHFWLVRQLILWVPEWVGLTFFKSGVAFAQMKNVRVLSLLSNILISTSEKTRTNKFLDLRCLRNKSTTSGPM